MTQIYTEDGKNKKGNKKVHKFELPVLSPTTIPNFLHP